MPPGEERRRAVCGRTACTDRCGGGRKPDQSGQHVPRGPGAARRAAYERWLTGHRLTGLFVIVAVVHGAIVDPVLRHSVLLRVAFLIVGAAGAVAYLYRELLARYVVPIYDYTVGDV
jgi:hypothetical protein